MANKGGRRSAQEIIKSRVPEELHYIVDDKTKFPLISQLWKLDADALEAVWSGIPSEIKPVLKAKNQKPGGTKGSRSLLPFSKEDIQKAGKYMALKQGAAVKDTAGTVYELNAVQILIKVKNGNKISTISLGKMA